MEHKITLTFGHIDGKKVVHRDVVFGNRLLAADMMLLDNDPRRGNPTQYKDMIHQRAMTSFGTLKMPVGLNVLLGLNSVDREDIEAGFNKFCELNREGRTSSYPESNVVKLYFGFEIEGTEYNLVEIGKLNTGKDEVEADALDERGVIRDCFLLGRRITKISTSDGASSIDGPVDLDKFKDLDAVDLNLLRTGGKLAAAFFRLRGAAVPGELDTESGDTAAAGNGDVGEGDPEPAKATDPDLSAGSPGAESEVVNS